MAVFFVSSRQIRGKLVSRTLCQIIFQEFSPLHKFQRRKSKFSVAFLVLGRIGGELARKNTIWESTSWALRIRYFDEIYPSRIYRSINLLQTTKFWPSNRSKFCHGTRNPALHCMKMDALVRNDVIAASYTNFCIHVYATKLFLNHHRLRMLGCLPSSLPWKGNAVRWRNQVMHPLEFILVLLFVLFSL